MIDSDPEFSDCRVSYINVFKPWFPYNQSEANVSPSTVWATQDGHTGLAGSGGNVYVSVAEQLEMEAGLEISRYHDR